MPIQQYIITTETAGAVLGALRKHVNELTWTAAKAFVGSANFRQRHPLC